MANDDGLLSRADRAIEISRSLRNETARIKAEARISQERIRRTLIWAKEGSARHRGLDIADMVVATSLENPAASKASASSDQSSNGCASA